MNSNKERRIYGAHLTSVDIFKKFILPEIKDKIHDFVWVDLFAGEGNLILPILELVPTKDRIDFFKEHMFLFDIQPDMVKESIENAVKHGIPKNVAEKNIIQRDTLESYPAFLKNMKFPVFHITNPPYLYLGYIAKHKETEQYLEYFKGDNEGFQDLYQIGMMNDLRNEIKNLVYIIPSNFLFGFSISNKIRNDFLNRYKIKKAVIFERKIFEFTGTNVIICFFERNGANNQEVSFRAVKINNHTEEKEYVLKPKNNYRAGDEFGEFVESNMAEKPLKARYYLMKEEAENNKGKNKIAVIDANNYVKDHYKKEEISVNDTLSKEIKSNKLWIRTVDTGSQKGRAGLYFIREELGVDGILVSKLPFRTHPIQIFFESGLSHNDLILIKDLFNSMLEYFRRITDSEFMTTYKYSDSQYVRKYLGLSQAKKLLQTIPILKLNEKEKEQLNKLLNEKRTGLIIDFIKNKNKSSKALNKFLQ